MLKNTTGEEYALDNLDLGGAPAPEPGGSEAVTVSVDKADVTMDPETRLVHEHLDGIQHGIDDNPEHDAAKGGALGALGGVAVGMAAGAMLGPVGALVGGLAGAAAGATLSALSVAAVDTVDNDDKVSGVGAGVDLDLDELPSPAVATVIQQERER